MNGRWIVHFRALLIAGVYFLSSAALGATAMVLAMMDVMSSADEGSPPWWLSGMCRVLQVVNAPMGNFFGLWDSSNMMSLRPLLLAAAWSAMVGYGISVVWHQVQKSIENRQEHESVPV